VDDGTSERLIAKRAAAIGLILIAGVLFSAQGAGYFSRDFCVTVSNSTASVTVARTGTPGQIRSF
jgi:hypothetical protein